MTWGTGLFWFPLTLGILTPTVALSYAGLVYIATPGRPFSYSDPKTWARFKDEDQFHTLYQAVGVHNAQ